ncbi:FemAB family XrtA/PEP-CTERM system-associated protein [Ningiella sp. W23]|uniref:FemAB family XrtA/PEP-CTERM system-associated protein n=1 Tax=Ningiella sp. W23 TaxID=3023715 RepID=UPI003757EE6D
MPNITVHKIDQNRAPEWDAYAMQSDHATAYHLFAWGQAVEAAYGYICHYFIAQRDGSTVGILPLVEMRSLNLQKLLCALPYCDVGGPVADSEEISICLTEHALDFAKASRISNIELRSSSRSLVEVQDTLPGKKVRMMLSLPDSSDGLMAQFKSKLRSQIRKAEKNGLVAEVSHYPQGSNEREEFYNIISSNMRNLGSPVHSFAWYEEVLEAYKDRAFISLVRFEGKAVGAALVLACGQRAVIPWASTLAEYNRLAPNMLLYWSVLSEAVKIGASNFDFGRSTVGEGTFNFKKQWGCKAQALEWVSYSSGNKLQASNDTKGKGRIIVERIWKRLPLAVSNTIGPHLRKHISL